MTYKELLAKAPDHLSHEFVFYLRDNSVVVYEDDDWIMVENFKYHTKEKGHYTAFIKNAGKSYELPPWHIYTQYCKGWEIVVKRKSDRSVLRWHVHFIQ